MEKQVKELIAKVLNEPVESLKEETTMYDTPKWDSLAHINIICGIEKMLGRPLTLDEIISNTSVGDWVNIVNKKIGESNKK